MGNDDDERAAKRARVDGGGDAMATTREKLLATIDSHLQAKLLLEFSAWAAAAGAQTDTIDFLFAFLQRSQSAASGDQSKGARGTDGGNGSGSNTVVVAAIVRGLRGLLAVKPSVVQPMIQLDAMSEQLTQCISVPEDFKLRLDMLRIVLDCLVVAGKLEGAEALLHTCTSDHDDGLRAVCLDGYLRVLRAGHHLQPTASLELVNRLNQTLLFGGDERLRALAAQLLGLIAQTSFEAGSTVEAPMQETVLNALACGTRDPCARVRKEIAVAFRCFRSSSAPDALYSHLLHKRQINEDLSEIDCQSVAMLTSGAVLTLLEDDDLDVLTETSASMRALCEGGLWSSDLLDRAISAHIELAARVGNREVQVLLVLENLEVFLARWEEKENKVYPIADEELSYLIGSLLTSSLAVAQRVLAVFSFLLIDNCHMATRLVEYIVLCSQTKQAAAVAPSQAFIQSVASSTRKLAKKWSDTGLVISSTTATALRGVAAATSDGPLSLSCTILYDALCGGTNRPAGQEHRDRFPRFLGQE